MSYIDDLNQAASEALAASASATESSQIIFDVANGDENTTVTTANGEVKTLAKAIADISNELYGASVQATTEEITLSAGQTEVTLTEATTNGMSLYVEGVREFDYIVTSSTSFTLPEALPDGTRIWVVGVEAIGGTAARVQEIEENGFTEWDVTTDYQEGAFVKVGRQLYQLADGGDGSSDPSTDGGVNWAEISFGDPSEFTVVSQGSSTGRTLSERFGSSVDILDFGATGDGASDDSGAQDSAHIAAGDRAVIYPYGKGQSYAGIETPFNMYGSYDSPLYERLQSGTPSSPSSNPNPVIFLQKYSSATRDVNSTEWEQGGVYSQITKVQGDAYAASGTFSARHEGGEGQIIAMHCRGEARHPDAEVWGGWSYAAITHLATTNGAKSAIAHEFNINNKGPDKGWMIGADEGASRGIVVTTQDGSNPVTHGLNIGRGQGAPDGYFWTGALFRGNSFVIPSEPLTEVGNGEAIRIEGSATGGAASNGIRLREGFMRVGISLTEVSYSNNCAVLLGDEHRISVGDGPSTSAHFSMSKSGAWANFNNMNIRINGTQVMKSRRTGWTPPTGTSDRNTFNTETIPLSELAQRVKALIDDLTDHGIIGA